MSDDKKRVSQFPGRRSELSKAVAASLIAKDQPTIGGSQGDFKRDPCGTCLSWRRDPRGGQPGIPLNACQCFFAPPVVHPIMDDTGQRMLATMLIRPPMTSDHEGCDQHDDGTDDGGDDGDGDGEPASALANAG
jgi:hypothetical protein